MNQDIGEVAGKVWEYLEANGEVTLTAIKKDLDLKPDLAGMSLGWLARENKVAFEKKGNSVKVSLNN